MYQYFLPFDGQAVVCNIDILFIHSVGRHFGCFPLWGCDYLCISYCVDIGFHFFGGGNVLGSGIAGSHGNAMFNFLRNCQAAFQSSCTVILHSHQQCMKDPIFFTSPSTCIIMSSVWSGVSLWFWSVFSLVVNDLEHPLLGLLTICVSSLEKYLFRCSPHF